MLIAIVAMDKAGATLEWSVISGQWSDFFLTAKLRVGMPEGGIDKGYVSVGSSISQIREIKSVKAIIDDMIKKRKTVSLKGVRPFF